MDTHTLEQAPLSDDLQQVVDLLRLRDLDPEYDNAPILDAYARISRSPDGELEKTDRQLSDILANISRRHARLGEVLRDDSASAWQLNAKRPGWKVLTHRLEVGKSNGVVAWHTDRLMRQPRDLERLIDFGKKGLVVGSCAGDYPLDDRDAQFTLRILTAAACKASDDTSRRHLRKQQAMREAGIVNGGARPFGFQAGPESTQAPAELVKAEADAIRWGVAAHIDGVSIRAITQEWNRRGLHTVKGTAFTPDRVRLVLLRASNAGLLEHDGVIVGRITEPVPDHPKERRNVEPIISEDELRQVRSAFTARKWGRPYANRYLLSGIARCGLCGTPMTGNERTVQRKGPAYRQRRYRCACERTGVDAPQAEAWVREQVAVILSSPTHARAIQRQSAELAKVEQRISDAERDGEGLAVRLGAGRMSMDAYDAAMEPLNQRLDALRAERDALRAVAQTGNSAKQRKRGRAEVEAEWDASAASNDAEALRGMIREAMPLGLRVVPAASRGRGSKIEDRLRIITPDTR